VEQLTKEQKLGQLDKASRHLQQGNSDAAYEIFSEVSDLDTTDEELLLKLGELAFNLGENTFAVHYFSKAAEQSPQNGHIQLMLGKAYNGAGCEKEALDSLAKSIELNPNLYESFVILGKRENDNNNFQAATKLLERAIELKPSNPESYGALIYTLRCSMRHHDALEYTKKLVRLQPNALNYTTLARVLIENNKIDEAKPFFEKAIQLDKTCGLAYHGLAAIKKFSEQDTAFINKAERVLQSDLPMNTRALFHFALGKMYNDLKQWDKAFEHYKQANIFFKTEAKPDYHHRLFNVIKHNYSKKLLRQANELGSKSEIPVFVVGMPRSGTTLIEQIIASHPDAAGAGEVSAISKIDIELTEQKKLSAKDVVERFNKAALNEHADFYLKVLRDRAGGDSKKIVDKMPGNFMYLGLIHLLFPNARIIHAIRNPLDTCLSCYFQAFQQVDYANDLDWLADQYRLYRNVIAHWKTILPKGKIIDVHYEQLIEAPETQMRSLIENCGLPWDERCLEYYKTEREIVTASVWQARQPIYKTY